jgi:hypothetical protein
MIMIGIFSRENGHWIGFNVMSVEMRHVGLIWVFQKTKIHHHSSPSSSTTRFGTKLERPQTFCQLSLYSTACRTLCFAWLHSMPHQILHMLSQNPCVLLLCCYDDPKWVVITLFHSSGTAKLNYFHHQPLNAVCTTGGLVSFHCRHHWWKDVACEDKSLRAFFPLRNLASQYSKCADFY